MIFLLIQLGLWLYFVVVITLILINNFISHICKEELGIAIREDEIAKSRRLWVLIQYYKVLAFVIGAAFAGIAGALYAGNIGYISPDNFKFMKS